MVYAATPGADMTATRSVSASLQQLGRTLLAGDLAGLPDAELVRRFVERRDEAAFTILVRRYGGVVFGVCRRLLRHEQDAEDAFQATFLVFARNAGSVQRAGAVGNWLYGVAYNVARKAKALRHKRAVKEREAAMRQQAAGRASIPDDLREVLDRELHALPDKYRAAILLCDFLGRTIREAAEETGCPPKTLGTRLRRGRALLARRLARRGVAISAGALPAALLCPSAMVAVPARLIAATVQAASGFAAGSAATVSPAVAALTTGVSNVMLLKTLKYIAVLACGVLALASLPAGPNKPVAFAAPAAQVAQRAAPAAPTEHRSANRAQRNSHLHHLLQFLSQLDLATVIEHLRAHGATGHDGLALFSTSTAADDKKEGKDKPALSGAWLRKEGELKIEFSDKDVMKIFPHGENGPLALLFNCTVEKDGRIKAKLTEVEGKDEVKEKVKQKLPAGLEFSFQWKVKDNSATLDDMKGDHVDQLKSHLEGDYEQKK